MTTVVPSAVPAPASEPVVLIEALPTRDGRRIGIARLNRPRAINALDLEMCELLLDAVSRWRDDPAVVAVLLAGQGEKGFCAGGDVARVIRERRAALAALPPSAQASSPAQQADGAREAGTAYGDDFFRVEYQLDRQLHELGKPLITWAHGVTMGGGLGLSVAGSHRVVTTGLKMAMPEIHIGLFPDVGGGWFLNRVPDEAGLLIALTGVLMNEADAVHARLADHVVPHGRQAAFVETLLAADWRGDAGRIVDEALRAVAVPFQQWPGSALRERGARIREIFGRSQLADIMASLAEAAAGDPWFQQPLANLQQGSPTAAAVTLEYYRRSRLLGLAEVLALDRTLAWHCLRGPDFPEGVRALLIDKDKAPRWLPRTAEGIDRALVERFFAAVAV